MPQTKKYVIKAGDRFGRLIVLRKNNTYSKLFGPDRREIFYDVRCDCGAEFTTRKYGLVHGTTRSCGCLRSDMLRDRKTGARKKRKVVITVEGVTHTLHDWAEIVGVPVSTLYSRRFRHGDVPEIVLKEYYK